MHFITKETDNLLDDARLSCERLCGILHLVSTEDINNNARLLKLLQRMVDRMGEMQLEVNFIGAI